jgi:hypothetical protein
VFPTVPKQNCIDFLILQANNNGETQGMDAKNLICNREFRLDTCSFEMLTNYDLYKLQLVKQIDLVY